MSWGLLLAVVSLPLLAAFPLTGGFSVDTSDRFQARAFYLSLFSASENTPMAWSGSVASCTPGTTSEDYKDAVMLRVNVFRALAGVPAVIDHRVDYDDKAQQAALMMSANNALDHTPPNTWDCWSVDGEEAAGNSNLSLGNDGWHAVFSQMRDDGANNAIVGHRRWILYPQTQQMGSGDIPVDGGFRETNALWVIDSHVGAARPPVRDDFVAWPPRGYIPYPLVFARWSFSLDGADFSAANVAMSRNGVNVPLSVEARSNTGVGEPTIVWKPEDGGVLLAGGAARPATDTPYDVTVSNVLVGGVAQAFSYRVTVIDPEDVAPGEPIPHVSGPATVSTGQPGGFQYVLDAGLAGYQLRVLQTSPYNAVEGGEGGSGNVVDGTDAAYDLITTGNAGTGVYAFHLAHPGAGVEYFELTPDFVLRAGSRLQFSSRLGWATSDQVAKVQISTNNGESWADVYSLAGIGGVTESGYHAHDLDLGAWVDRSVRIRFAYIFESGSFYPQTDANVGWSVDNIALLNADQVTQSSTTDLDDSGSFDFSPALAGAYGLQVGTSTVEGFPASVWGDVLSVSARNGPLPVPSGFNVDGSSGPPDALTDGIIIIRAMFGFTGAALVQGAVAPDGADAAAIAAHVQTFVVGLDIDGDGRQDALTDGILLIRYMFGFRGDALVAGAVSPGAPRSSGADVAAWIAGLGL